MFTIESLVKVIGLQYPSSKLQPGDIGIIVSATESRDPANNLPATYEVSMVTGEGKDCGTFTLRGNELVRATESDTDSVKEKP